jgi:hypothetical protein
MPEILPFSASGFSRLLPGGTGTVLISAPTWSWPGVNEGFDPTSSG